MAYSKRKEKSPNGLPFRGALIAVLGLGAIIIVAVLICSMPGEEGSASESSQALSNVDVPSALKSYVEDVMVGIAQGRISPEFVEAAARAGDGVKGYDLKWDLVKMCQGGFKPDSVREFLKMAMFYLVKIPDDDGRVRKSVAFSDYVLSGDSMFSRMQKDADECLAEIHKQAELIVAATDVIAERIAQDDDPQMRTNFCKLEPWRLAASKLAKGLLDFTHSAMMAIEYNRKVSRTWNWKKGETLDSIRQKYLDSGIDERAFPVDVKCRAEQNEFISSTWQNLFKERRLIWKKLECSYEEHPEWRERLWLNAGMLSIDVDRQCSK